MLLFFGKDFNFKSVECNRFHKIALTEYGMRKLVQFANVFLENNGTSQVQRLTQIMQDRHPPV